MVSNPVLIAPVLITVAINCHVLVVPKSFHTDTSKIYAPTNSVKHAHSIHMESQCQVGFNAIYEDSQMSC